MDRSLMAGHWGRSLGPGIQCVCRLVCKNSLQASHEGWKQLLRQVGESGLSQGAADPLRLNIVILGGISLQEYITTFLRGLWEQDWERMTGLTWVGNFDGWR